MECVNKFVGVHFADMKLQVHLRVPVNLFFHLIISIMIFKCKNIQCRHKTANLSKNINMST